MGKNFENNTYYNNDPIYNSQVKLLGSEFHFADEPRAVEFDVVRETDADDVREAVSKTSSF